MEYLKDSLDTGQTEGGSSNFQSIEGHRGLCSLSDPAYLVNSHNLLIAWESGEIIWEPLTNIMADFKHCGKFKAMLVTDGDHTKGPTENDYSGFVSLRKLRLAMFFAELNNLQLWRANVGNAYLQGLTREKLCIVAGPEFEEVQGHVLIMYKALYGTTSAGAFCHDKPFDILQ